MITSTSNKFKKNTTYFPYLRLFTSHNVFIKIPDIVFIKCSNNSIVLCLNLLTFAIKNGLSCSAKRHKKQFPKRFKFDSS